MTEANAINAATTGIVGNTGTSFTGSPVTQFNVQIGGATSSTLANVALGNQQLLVGNTSAAPTGKSLSIVRQVFTATGAGTYTPTSGMVYCDVEVIGAGGGSGGCAATSVTNSNAAAGGGGGGGYSKKTISAATIGASKSFSIGSGGSAGSSGQNNGGGGGTTTFGSTLLQATGGSGGTGSSSGSGAGANLGGAGGVGSLGDINISGQCGGYGFVITGTPLAGLAQVAQPGLGGPSFYGFNSTSPNVQGGAAIAGSNYGCGATGGALGQNQAAIAGAAGANGYIVVTEYVLS